MISFDVFMIGLFVVSALTGLTTEAIKHILTALKVNYQSNVLSGIVAVLLSMGVGFCYILATGMAITVQSVVCIVVLAFASWLSAMVGYDKVIQIINQFKNIKKG
jgi:hypothetical protein